jgi:methionyl-tRNA formyltransferase
MPERGPLNLVLMGTGPFATPAFDALCETGHRVQIVLTRPERPGPGKRPPQKSPVRQWAESRNFLVEAPESVNSEEAKSILRRLAPDLLVVCDYGQILRSDVLQLARLGGINLHGSLLPAHRGAAPVQWAVLRGDRETGVSVIHMTPKLDAGPVITVRKTPIHPKETAGELEQRLSLLGVEAVLEAVEFLAGPADSDDDSKSPHAPFFGIEQDSDKASRAPRLTKEDGRIDWRKSASQIQCHVMGMQPWPNAFTEIPKDRGEPQRLVVLDVDAVEDSEFSQLIQADESKEISVAAKSPGTVHILGDRLLIATGEGWIELQCVKPAGKRAMKVAEWLRGRPVQTGTVLASS